MPLALLLVPWMTTTTMTTTKMMMTI